MDKTFNRRSLYAFSASFAGLLSLFASPASALPNFHNPMPRRRAQSEETGEQRLASRLNQEDISALVDVGQYTAHTPDGQSLKINLYSPKEADTEVPVVLFCPSRNVRPDYYAAWQRYIAAQGFLVIAPQFLDRRGESASTSTWRRLAEARFALDQIFSIRTQLRAISDKIQPNRLGVVGHGDGAAIALMLIGFADNMSIDYRFADGRVRAAIGIDPDFQPAPDGEAMAPPHFQPVIAHSLVITQPGHLPRAPEGSGMFGMTIPHLSHQGRSGEIAALASALFFDWQLNEDTTAHDGLLALHGRPVDGVGEVRLARA